MRLKRISQTLNTNITLINTSNAPRDVPIDVELCVKGGVAFPEP